MTIRGSLEMTVGRSLGMIVGRSLEMTMKILRMTIKMVKMIH